MVKCQNWLKNSNKRNAQWCWYSNELTRGSFWAFTGPSSNLRNQKDTLLLTACWQLPLGRWSEPHGSWSPSSSCESGGPAGAGRRRSFWSGWCASLWNPHRTGAEGSRRWSSHPHGLQSWSEAHRSQLISLKPEVWKKTHFWKELDWTVLILSQYFKQYDCWTECFLQLKRDKFQKAKATYGLEIHNVLHPL